MRVSCKVLRPFALSHDGVKSQAQAVGDTAEVPEDLVGGLVAEGFVEIAAAEIGDGEPEAKAVKRAPKNKAIESAPEDKDS